MRSRSGGKAGNGKGVSRPVGAGGGGGNGNVKGVSSSGSGEVKGYFSNGKLWGDMERDGCHRCGGIGHKAAWCVADMPDDVKRWCLNRSAESSHVVSDGSGEQVYVSHVHDSSTSRSHHYSRRHSPPPTTSQSRNQSISPRTYHLLDSYL
ncbi:hypothetical protein K435DRAFT_963573 [Dendrothele bispora CBS 962.96]|uniref:Uncharacterized protein n=1 Tax=Dendrothele bispora (strain CBS 962.96) TaxID=1314807 RepID=A0A4S8MFF8_DENBC|nr:hypothetical protein K435DRAFT_963573 [Dendrothele bispora CBS 962.96]